MRLAYIVVVAVVTLFTGRDGVSAAADMKQVNTYQTLNVNSERTTRFLRVESTIETENEEERALPSSLTKIAEKLKPTADKVKPLTSKVAPLSEKLTDKAMAIAVRLKPIADTFSGKLKPIADKLMPILKPFADKLKTVPVVKKIVEKFKTFAEKIKNYKVGGHTLSERYTMAKFENWFKQNKSPDDVKAMLKVGEGATVNTKNYDLSIQYNAFFQWATRDKEMKAKKAAAAATA
ncbi:hypothetical protein P3T76_001567 [Phytophthora citrophthora]|uniref:RxLR effector protein n=1 Tax=Phytophthora citrophthora TaxID=4793 RepID=A0AAD9LUP6_9STRA|nr:hypothetical protein P3T76_001567 [Phytophthora citrophthora]